MTKPIPLYYLHAIVPAIDASVGEAGLRSADSLGAVRWKDLAVLYTDLGSSGIDAGRLEADIASADAGEAFVREHQDFLCHLRDETSALLPFPFCTLYRHLDPVLEMLQAHGDLFRATLGRLAGAAEWSIRLVQDEETVGTDLVDDPAMRALRDDMEAASPGRRFLLQQRFDRSLRDRRRLVLRERIDALHEDLRALARDAVEIAHGGVERSQAPRGDRGPMSVPEARRTAFKGAYLVADRDRDRFLSRLDDRAGRLKAEGWCTLVQGPWPAYSFTNLQEDAA